MTLGLLLFAVLVANALWPPSLACLDVRVIFERVYPFNFPRNSAMELDCDVRLLGDVDPKRGNFSASVEWFRNGRRLPIAAAAFPRLSQVVAESCSNSRTAGWYGCRVRTKYGTLKVPEVPAACKELSRPRLILHHGAATLTSGALAILECRVDRLWSHLLEPTFAWTLNNTRLRTDGSHPAFRSLPCPEPRASPPPTDRLRLPPLSRCLYIWELGAAARGSFACAVQRGQEHRSSAALELRRGAKVTRPFPPPSDRPAVFNVRANAPYAWLPCAAAGVLRQDEGEWLPGRSNASGPVSLHPFLLELRPMAMLAGQQWVERCVRRGGPGKRPQVLREVHIRVYPSDFSGWNIRPCLGEAGEPLGLIHRVNDSLQLHCRASLECGVMETGMMGPPVPAFRMFEVAWFLNGREIKSEGSQVRVNGSSLSIARLDPTRHSGFFQCRVRTTMQVMPPDERWKSFLVLVSPPPVPRWVRVSISDLSQSHVRLRVQLDTSRLPLCGKLSCQLTQDGRYPAYEISQVRKTDSSPLVVLVDFHNLHPFHSYTAMCGYFHNSGRKMVRRSAKVTFRTLEGRPSQQPEFEIKEEGPGSLLVTWQPLEEIDAFGNVTRHRVQWRLITAERFEVLELPVSRYKLRLKGLLGNALYQVSVCSGTSVGYPLFEEVGRRPLLLLGHTVPLDSRTLVPRCSIIDRVWKARRAAIGGPKRLAIRWSVKPAVARFVDSAVTRWNLTVLFPDCRRPVSCFVPSNASAKTLAWPAQASESGERRVLVWLEALDAHSRVLDDAVIAVRNYPSELDVDRHPLAPPANVSVQCLRSDYGLLVRWSDQPANALCRNPQTGYSCFVRIRLIPLPFHRHRRRRYIRLSPYANASAVSKGVFHVTGLRPDTVYAVGVAFERQPPLVSDFATPRGCRVLPLPLPVPNVTLVRRLDASRVRVRVGLPREGRAAPQGVRAVSSSSSSSAAAAAAAAAPAQAPLSRIKLVALRFCDAAHRPFPALPGNPAFISPTEALSGRVLDIPFPAANASGGRCSHGVRLRRESATFVQAAFCYERDRCAAWSDFVRVRPETPEAQAEPRPAVFPRAVALIASLAAAMVAALVVVAVLAERLRRTRRQLRQRARDGLEFGNGVISLARARGTSEADSETEREPFVPPPPPPPPLVLPRTKL